MNHRPPTRPRPRLQQMPLFRPPTQGPGWQDLPDPTRQRLIKLLGRLLNDSTTAHRPAQRKEVGDE